MLKWKGCIHCISQFTPHYPHWALNKVPFPVLGVYFLSFNPTFHNHYNGFDICHFAWICSCKVWVFALLACIFKFLWMAYIYFAGEAGKRVPTPSPFLSTPEDVFKQRPADTTLSPVCKGTYYSSFQQKGGQQYDTVIKKTTPRAKHTSTWILSFHVYLTLGKLLSLSKISMSSSVKYRLG